MTHCGTKTSKVKTPFQNLLTISYLLIVVLQTITLLIYLNIIMHRTQTQQKSQSDESGSCSGLS